MLTLHSTKSINQNHFGLVFFSLLTLLEKTLKFNASENICYNTTVAILFLMQYNHIHFHFRNQQQSNELMNKNNRTKEAKDEARKQNPIQISNIETRILPFL